MGLSFADRCREIARSFLLTAVVVDDELSISDSPMVHGGLAPPRQRPSGPTRETEPEARLSESEVAVPHPLLVDPITWSFVQQGMVCGLIAPNGDGGDMGVLSSAVARADLVVLDWRLDRASGADARPLLRRILADDKKDRLRLVAFYTGEPDREWIRDQIEECLLALDSQVRTVSRNENDQQLIDFGACRIVVYGKPGGIEAPGNGDVVLEAALASRLVEDFSMMVQGLLPSLVLTALTAVRENVYRVMESFGSQLDAAFLAHRACLTSPAEAEQHIVEQIASELCGIMDDEVGRTKPAGIAAIERWLLDRLNGEKVVFGPDKEATLSEVLAMLTHGVDEAPDPSGGVARTTGFCPADSQGALKIVARAICISRQR